MLVFSLDGHLSSAENLISTLSVNVLDDELVTLGELELRHFPDGESYLNILSDVDQQEIVVLCQLHQPNEKIIDLMLFAETAKQQGAKSICLVAPYLAYMRQDKKFHAGESITSRHVATWISERFDSIITIDPHLHRYHCLNEIYTIPNRVIHATDLIADYIRQNIAKPLVIGPDSESEQWANAVAERAGCDAMVLNKIRRGDHDVEVSLPQLENYLNHQPILIDDIISTGKTMIKAAENIVKLNGKAPICIGVHGVFAPGAYAEMQAADIAEVLTCNTIGHATNVIDVTALLVAAVIEIRNKNLSSIGSSL
ncbi:MAG: ribose-phosphate pyrophosphokinase [Oleispira sp.]